MVLKALWKLEASCRSWRLQRRMRPEAPDGPPPDIDLVDHPNHSGNTKSSIPDTNQPDPLAPKGLKMATLIERDLVLIGLAHSVKVIVTRVRRKAEIAIELEHGIEIRPKLNLGAIPARYGLQFGNLCADQVGLGIRLYVG